MLNTWWWPHSPVGSWGFAKSAAVSLGTNFAFSKSNGLVVTQWLPLAVVWTYWLFLPRNTQKHSWKGPSGLEYLQAVLTYQDMWKAASFSEVVGKNSWCTSEEEPVNLGCWEVRKEQTRSFFGMRWRAKIEILKLLLGYFYYLQQQIIRVRREFQQAISWDTPQICV